MADVTNTTDVDLPIPGGPIVPAKKTIRVTKFEYLKHNSIVQAWLTAKALTVAADEAKPAKAAKAKEDK